MDAVDDAGPADPVTVADREALGAAAGDELEWAELPWLCVWLCDGVCEGVGELLGVGSKKMKRFDIAEWIVQVYPTLELRVPRGTVKLTRPQFVSFPPVDTFTQPAHSGITL